MEWRFAEIPYQTEMKFNDRPMTRVFSEVISRTLEL